MGLDRGTFKEIEDGADCAERGDGKDDAVEEILGRV